MPRPATLARVLAEDPALAEWLARERTCAALTPLARATLPRALAPLVRVTAAQPGERLELAATSGAVAAAARQRSAAMLSAMAREGWHFTEIRVRVQVGAGAVPAIKGVKNQRDASGAQALFGLAATLSDGPLRQSLLAWSRRSRGR